MSDQPSQGQAPVKKQPPQDDSSKFTLPKLDLLDLSYVLIDNAKECSAGLLADGIALGADVTVQDEHGMTVLHHAAARGARPCIRVLVASGKCDYLIRDKLGRYASELAIEGGRDFAVARLLRKKQLQQAHAQGVPAYIPRS